MTLIDNAVPVHFQVQIAAAGRTAVFELTGELDASTLPSFSLQTTEVLAAGTVELVLDIRRLYRLDYAALAFLTELSTRLTQAGGGVALAGVRPRVRGFLEQSALGRALPRFADVEEALAATATPKSSAA
jgi:anti-anti-sigma factor